MRLIAISVCLLPMATFGACSLRDCGVESGEGAGATTSSPIRAALSSALNRAKAPTLVSVSCVAIEVSSAPTPRCPHEMARVGEKLCIDRWEASLVDENGKPINPYEPIKGKNVVAVSQSGVIPQGYISLFEATIACKAAGKRTCTTREWVDACQGMARSKRTYPYGNTYQKGACNDVTRIHPVSLVYPRIEATRLDHAQ